jgi:hypothetical protein
MICYAIQELLLPSSDTCASCVLSYSIVYSVLQCESLARTYLNYTN